MPVLRGQEPHSETSTVTDESIGMTTQLCVTKLPPGGGAAFQIFPELTSIVEMSSFLFQILLGLLTSTNRKRLGATQFLK